MRDAEETNWRLTKSELESATGLNDSTLLPDNTKVLGGSRGGIRDETPQEGAGTGARGLPDANEIGGIEEFDDVPITTVNGRKFKKILYDAATRGKLGITVDSDRTIDVHTVPVDELDKWLDGKRFHGSSFLRTKRLNIEFNHGPEFENDWYLLFDNTSDYPAEIEYDVYER